MKTRGAVESWLYSLINLGARSELVVSAMPGRFTPNKRPDTHCVGGWLGTSARLATSTAEVRNTQHVSQYRGPIRIPARWYNNSARTYCTYNTSQRTTRQSAQPYQHPHHPATNKPRKQPGREYNQRTTGPSTSHKTVSTPLKIK